jgi:hypothetical protein
MDVIAKGRFVKQSVPPIEQYGQYRGPGCLEVHDTGLRIIGSHPYPPGIQWALGLLLALVSLMLSFNFLLIMAWVASVAFDNLILGILSILLGILLGILSIYLFLQYGLLKRQDLDLPFTQITGLAVNDVEQILAVSFAGDKGVREWSPAVLKSPDWHNAYDALIPHVGRWRCSVCSSEFAVRLLAFSHVRIAHRISNPKLGEHIKHVSPVSPAN